MLLVAVLFSPRTLLLVCVFVFVVSHFVNVLIGCWTLCIAACFFQEVVGERMSLISSFLYEVLVY